MLTWPPCFAAILHNVCCCTSCWAFAGTTRRPYDHEKAMAAEAADLQRQLATLAAAEGASAQPHQHSEHTTPASAGVKQCVSSAAPKHAVFYPAGTTLEPNCPARLVYVCVRKAQQLGTTQFMAVQGRAQLQEFIVTCRHRLPAGEGHRSDS